MAKADFSFGIPERGLKEEDLTAKQKNFIESLLDGLDAKGITDAQISQLGKRQASFFINRLIAIRDGDADENSRIKVDRSSQKTGCMALVIVTLAMIIATIWIGLL